MRENPNDTQLIYELDRTKTDAWEELRSVEEEDEQMKIVMWYGQMEETHIH